MKKRDEQRMRENEILKRYEVIEEQRQDRDFGCYNVEEKEVLNELYKDAMYMYVEGLISSRFWNLVFVGNKTDRWFANDDSFYYNQKCRKNLRILSEKYKENC